LRANGRIPHLTECAAFEGIANLIEDRHDRLTSAQPVGDVDLLRRRKRDEQDDRSEQDKSA
jgi:hypothetical protein